MDELIDNFPGASTNKGYGYLNNEDKFDDNGIFGSVENENPNPFYQEVK
jgi:hypothetical protein